MKKLIINFGILLSAAFISAQPSLMVKIAASPGVSQGSTPALINRHDPVNEFQFNLIQTERQLYGSILIHLPLGTPFFLEGGVTYTQKNMLYEAVHTYPAEGYAAHRLMNESKKLIMLPVNFGVTLNKVEVISGFTAQKIMSLQSELYYMEGFRYSENSLSLGWQMGARYKLGNTLLGIEYLGMLQRVGQEMYVHNQCLEIRNVPGAWIFSLQYRI